MRRAHPPEDDNYFDLLAQRYGYLRQFVPEFLNDELPRSGVAILLQKESKGRQETAQRGSSEFGMTQAWRGGLDTSSLAVRAIVCALLFLALGAVGPIKRKPAPPGFVPRRVALEIVSKDSSRPASLLCLAGAGANALPARD